MDERKRELLSYIRTLYDRENDRASKAGMTYWAIIAGLIYVVWHLLNGLTGIPVETLSRLDFLHAFSQIHLALLSLASLITLGGSFHGKGKLDYRIFSHDGGELFDILFFLILLGLPLYAIAEIKYVENHISFFHIQNSINFWIIAVFIVLIIASFVIKEYRNRINKLPPANDMFVTKSKNYKFINFLASLIFIEIFLGNSINIAVDLYTSVDASKIHIVAFDVSVIIFGIALLLRNMRYHENIGRLARFERDIVIHDLTEKEILERIQEEYLGWYVGDWMEQLIGEIRNKGEILSTHSDKVDDLIKEVDAIDKNYVIERKGRYDKYVADLELQIHSYNESVSSLLTWLEQARVHASSHKDSFLLSIIETSLIELGESRAEVHEKANRALAILRE